MLSYTAEQIREANRARARLGRTYDKPHSKIADPRLPKRPALAYTLYVQDRFASGEIEGTVPEASKELAREWKALSEGEQKVYFFPSFCLFFPPATNTFFPACLVFNWGWMLMVLGRCIGINLRSCLRSITTR